MVKKLAFQKISLKKKRANLFFNNKHYKIGVLGYVGEFCVHQDTTLQKWLLAEKDDIIGPEV